MIWLFRDTESVSQAAPLVTDKKLSKTPLLLTDRAEPKHTSFITDSRLRPMKDPVIDRVSFRADDALTDTDPATIRLLHTNKSDPTADRPNVDKVEPSKTIPHTDD
jgi:hypothetical protein